MTTPIKVCSWQLDHKFWHPETRPLIQLTPAKSQPDRHAPSEASAKPPSPLDAPETVSSHITRLLGKRCFSCGTTNAVQLKFCVECGAPLFRPGRAPGSL